MNKFKPVKLEADHTTLVIVDVQGTLSRHVINREGLLESLKLLIRGSRLFGIDITWTEHVPDKIGPTHPDLVPLFGETLPIVKDSFSCCGTSSFMDRLSEKTETVLLAGIETHICVYQTARDLLEKGYNVEIIYDATSARTADDKKIGINRLRSMGAGIMTVEMCLYDLQGRAKGPHFRELINLVKIRDRSLLNRKKF